MNYSLRVSYRLSGSLLSHEAGRLFLLRFIFLTWGSGRRVRLWGLLREGSGVPTKQAPRF